MKHPSPSETVSLAPRAAVTPNRNMVAVASGKGGVGKTWFAITLAHALAKEGENVLLFDGDLGLANIDIQLGLMAKYDIGNVVTGRITLNQAVTRFEGGGYDIIAGRSGSGSLSNIPATRLLLLQNDLQVLAKNYSRVLVDLGAGVEKPVRLMAEGCGVILVICTDEPTSLTDAYAFIKLINGEKPSTDMRVVVNAANSVREGERTYETLRKACANFLKISPPLAGIVRRDTKVRDAIRNQTSILTRYPTTEAAEDVMLVASRLLRENA